MRIVKFSGNLSTRKTENIFNSTNNIACLISEDVETIVGAVKREEDGTMTSFHVEFSMAEIDYIKEQLDKHYQERLTQ